MSACNRPDLQTLGSQPIMPKNLPDHWSRLTNNRLNLKTSGESPILLEESIKHTSILIIKEENPEDHNMYINRLDLGTRT